MRRTAPHRVTQPAPAGAWLPPLLLFVSGAVALVYEVVWQRQFALVLGSGATATAAVLAAYFAGLGAGAWTVGRLAQRWSRPLRAYVGLELLVGGGALLVTPLLSGFEALYPRLFSSLADQPALFTAVRVATAFVVLLIPTFCMGGTLPLLGGFVDRERRRLGLTAGWLYVVNTAGAALGALSVPFLLLPRLGLTHTVWLCAGINLILAATAWNLNRRAAGEAPAPPSPPAKKPAAPESPTGVLPLALISGFVTFALQVLWNRAFAQVHENSMHSFALIVAVVIFALALGAQIARLALRRNLAPRTLIGRAWIAGGLVIAAGPWLFLQLTGGLGYLGDTSGQLTRLAGQAVLALFAPMALVGVALPALMEQAGRAPGETAGRVLGRLLAVNLLGSVTGALAAGFLLPGWLGLWGGMIWLGSLVFLAGLWVRLPRHGLIYIAAGLLLLLPFSRLNLPRVKLDGNTQERLLALTEGPHGITAVTEQEGSRRLKLNNHYALGGTAATGDERMQTHLPLLLHAAPRSVAFLGLGTGISAGGATFHPVKRITAMELVPEVIAAARTHFRDANAGVLDDARTTVVADDARNFLRGSGEKFDVIIGDLVVPWRQGEGALFTQEQFAAARAALTPGGLFCQWLPLFQLTEEQLHIVLRTFLAEFPRAQVWRGDFSPTAPAIALIATSEGTGPDPVLVQRRLAEMKPDPTNPHLQLPEAVWMHFVGVLEGADLSGAESRLNTEDRPWVELLGPGTTGQGSWFTGRAFQDWLDAVSVRSLARPNLLTPAGRNGAAAGGALGAMTLAMHDENRDGVMAAREQLRTLLPPETYRSLFP